MVKSNGKKETTPSYIKSLEKVFQESNKERRTAFYCYGAWRQSKRKREFYEYARKLENTMGIPRYNPDLGIPLGQRKIAPYLISKENVLVEGEDMHICNNAAIMQLFDDIARTAIMDLTPVHEILQKRLGKAVTPETLNRVMEVWNHTIGGAAAVQEHMFEINPLLVKDGYVKLFCGDDRVTDLLDKRIVLDINRLFSPEKATFLKKELGDKIFALARIPTIAVRNYGSAMTKRWVSTTCLSAFANVYGISGETAINTLVYTLKHRTIIGIGDTIAVRYGRGENSPGGIPFGYICDIVQTDRVYPDDPVKYLLDVAEISSIMLDAGWLQQMLSGGLGAPIRVLFLMSNDVFDNIVEHMADWVKEKYGGYGKAPWTISTIEEVAKVVAKYCQDIYDSSPLVCEMLFGGSLRSRVMAYSTAIIGGLASGHPMIGVEAAHLSQMIRKERTGRLGFFAQDQFHNQGHANDWTLLTDQSQVMEMRNASYPDYNVVANLTTFPSAIAGAYIARGGAYACNPLVKIAFSENLSGFDFGNIRRTLVKGALREFMPEGERDPVIPPH
ncbi:MAG: coenzyme-B sulfoethylthiotransferase subunit alpha [Candidatus Methanosuratus sp.]|nr:coenzyme-B sulfoethylthiotransferase subunit alpha [Candidatus Methanosuratincola sp.]